MSTGQPPYGARPHCESLHRRLHYREPQATRDGEASRLTWLTIPKAVKDDVCTMRLLCKTFRDAADEAFAVVLGDRVFRMTHWNCRPQGYRKDRSLIASRQDTYLWLRSI
jgi:hypothetical protein